MEVMEPWNYNTRNEMLIKKKINKKKLKFYNESRNLTLFPWTQIPEQNLQKKKQTKCYLTFHQKINKKKVL